MKILGQAIKTARKSLGITLRELEEATGISNAYLSQIETGRIKGPSGKMLYRISQLLLLDFDSLMVMAGHIDGPTKKNPLNALAKLKLTEDEETELFYYLRFYRAQKKRSIV